MGEEAIDIVSTVFVKRLLHLFVLASKMQNYVG